MNSLWIMLHFHNITRFFQHFTMNFAHFYDYFHDLKYEYSPSYSTSGCLKMPDISAQYYPDFPRFLYDILQHFSKYT